MFTLPRTRSLAIGQRTDSLFFKMIVKKFFTIFCFINLCLWHSNDGYAQFSPANCGNIQCTSNDVRIIGAYISGPNNTAINCGALNPFDNAELHLIVSSNTQRIGVSISGNFVAGSTNIAIGQCFGEKLNNGTNNNLVYSLGHQLARAACGTSFSLANIFTSWGTGNKNFCTSGDPQCPATPAKCRYKEGEIITVDVKLDVDFSWQAGDCSPNNSSLIVAFVPSVTAEHITYPLQFDWDFDNNGTIDATTHADDAAGVADAGTSHTYPAAGTYTATLTVTDATTDQPVIKSTQHSISVEACCTLEAPTVSLDPYCSGDGKTVADLPQSDANGNTYHWYDGVDPNTSYELDPTTVLTDGATYYVSISNSTCESPRTAVTITVTTTPGATNTGSALCSTQPGGTTASFDLNSLASSVIGTQTGLTVSWFGSYNTITGELSNAITPDGNGHYTSASATIYALVTNENCSSIATVTLTVNTTPAVYTLSANNDFCTGTAGGTVTLSNSESGVNYVLQVYDATNDVWNNVPGSAKGGTGSSLAWTGVAAGTYKVVATNATTACSSHTASTILTGKPCAYTFTQGFYGATTANNKTCAGTDLKTLLSTLLTTSIQIGGPSKSVSIPVFGTSGPFKIGGTGTTVTKTVQDWLIQIMPGGSTASGLLSGNPSILQQSFNNYTPSGYITKQSKIGNVLLSQTIALALNMRLAINAATPLSTISLDVPTALLNAPGTVVYMNTTQLKQKVSGCTTQLGTCTNSYPLNKNVIRALGTNKTVAGLLALANEALNASTGTGYTKNGATFTWADLNSTIDAINRGFDRGAMFNAFATTALPACANTLSTSETTRAAMVDNTVTDLSVAAYPNPYSDHLRLVVTNPKAGYGTLEVYNMLGQKVRTIYTGYIPAGTQSFEYNVPSAHRSNLIYMLRLGNRHVTGKVFQAKE